MPAKRIPGLMLLAALGVTALVYANALTIPLLWDDHMLVSRANIRALAPLWTYFSREGALDDQFYRPLSMLSLALDQRAYGGNVVGFHVTNLVGHLTSAALVYALARRGGAGAVMACASATAWALLPRLTEGASWISGRMDVLAVACTLGALLAWESPRRGARPLAAILMLAGLLFKEVAIAAPLAIAAGEATRVRDDAAAGSACGRGRLAFVAAPVLAYAALRLAAVGVSAPSDFTGGFVDRARLVLRAVGALAAMSLDPFRPRAVIALRDLPNAPMEVLGALVLVAGVYLVVRVARRGTPHEAQALALCVGGVMPVAQIIPLQGFALTSDRYLYLPLAGLAILTAIWVSDRARARWIPTGAAVAAGALAVAGAVGVRVRNDQMQSAVVFWATEAHRSGPNEPASFESLGEELQRASHPELAGEAFVRSLERTPALPRDSFFPIVARLRLAQCLSALGEVSAAEDADREVIARQPDLVDHYVELARVSATGGDVTGARAALAAGEVQSPGNPVLAAAAEEVEVRARAAALAASLAHDWSGPEPRPSLAQRALRRAELLSTLGLVREAEGAYIAVLDAGDASPAAVAEAADVLTLRGTSDGLDAVEHWLGDHGAESPDAAVLREALRSRREEERDVERARATALGK